MNVDYIIVGCGLAGIAFAETCLQNNKSIFVFDNNSQTSSTVAAGIYNPVILKRFSGLQDAKQQLDLLNVFYKLIEQRLNIKIDFKTLVLRKFTSIEDQNNWFTAADKPNLEAFLSLEIYKQKYNYIDSPYDFGEVLQTGYVDTALLLTEYQSYLEANHLIQKSKFDYEKIIISDDFVSYNNIKATRIVFAEGYGIHSNVYFNHLPLDGTKGELFIIKAKGLNLDCILNSSIFILPLGNDLFKIGATYNWFDKTNIPTEDGKSELIDRLKEIISCDFEIIAHQAGVRPTVKDRKALIGTHPNHPNLHILNGLGTRGVMLAPTMAWHLFDSIENGFILDKNIDIKRFTK